MTPPKSMLSVGVLLGALSGCVSYTGTARSVEPDAVEAERGWVRVEGVPIVRQRHHSDCGPAALSAVLQFWGLNESRDVIERRLGSDGDERPGAPAGALRDYARGRALSAYVFEGNFTELRNELEAGRPVIVGLHQATSERVLRHYAVVVGIHPSTGRVLTMDPAHGLREDSLDGFTGEWRGSKQVMLVIFPPSGARAAELSPPPSGEESRPSRASAAPEG